MVQFLWTSSIDWAISYFWLHNNSLTHAHINLIMYYKVKFSSLGPNNIQRANVFTLHLGLLSFLGSFFPKNMFSSKGIFKWNALKLFIYCIYSFPNMSYVFYNQIWRNTNFWKCTNFAKFCVLSWNFFIISNHTQNMLTLSSLIFNVINYKFSLNNIYVASHLHVEKDSWTILKP